ncbi:MAG TPA: 5'-nucleotidase C-terminal domain-containing protein [Aggregatilineales bacterium]|nr:5'-nucleotidase C-terminal domain-containing protein [Anaerolineales bacterium]HRE49600.1 5'-nucleotidase C-terminal domain-containing protein [Aggregatilineales bacterium]
MRSFTNHLISMRGLLLGCLITALLWGGFALPTKAQDTTYTLTIMHTNDTRARHLPESSGDGGAAREATVIKQIRAKAKNSILLDAGGRFTGTLFHKIYKGADNVQIMNLLGYQAMTLSNTEFDDGDQTLLRFIEGLNFPVVSSNIDASRSILGNKILPSVIIEVNGEKIGILGLTPADTPRLSSPGQAIAFNGGYANAIQRQVILLGNEGVNKIILLSQIGYQADQALAAEISGVDVIIGGNSWSLLSNRYRVDNPAYVYPTVAQSKDGEPVLIVQAGGGNLLFMGRLDVTFNAEGVAETWAGDTIFLSQYIAPDPAVSAVVSGFQVKVDELLTTPIRTLKNEPANATGEFPFDRRNAALDCRGEECALGNLITDAMRFESGAQIAIMNGGAIRAGLPAGTITNGEILEILPFENLLSTFKLRGSDVVLALENSVSRVDADSGTGRFLQVSGLRYSYLLSAPVGERIVSVEIASEDGKSFTPIVPDTIYTVATIDFLRRGGDGYNVLAEKAIDSYDFGRFISEVVINYIEFNSPVTPAVEGRILIVESGDAPAAPTPTTAP